MGICWSYISGKSKPVPVADPPTPTPPAPEPAEPIIEPDPLPSSVAHLFDWNTSFLVSNVSRTSRLFTNLTSLISQMSGAIATIWVNDAEDNELSAATEDENIPDGRIASGSKLRCFTFAQLKAATLNFRMDRMLGQGGFGSVYKGWIKENVPSQGTGSWAIAVKKLDAGCKQEYRQWRRAQIG